MDEIERGFEASAVRELRGHLKLSRPAIAEVLGISARTLKRRESSGRLTPEESDRLFRVVRLFEAATDSLGSEAKARQWMTMPQHALGGRVPLQMARYQPGALEVERLLGRLSHGIPL